MSGTKSRITFDGAILQWPNGLTVALNDIAPSVRDAVLAYGLKQIISDAGAVPAGTPESHRVALMEKRREAIASGEWSFRAGFSAPVAPAKRDLMFAALVAECVLDESTRAQWYALKPSERDAIWAMYPTAHAHMPKSAAPVAPATLAKLGL